MNIHLVRSEEFSPQSFNELIAFLQSFDGPVRFMAAGSSVDFPEAAVDVEDVDEEKFLKQEEISFQEMICHNILLPEKRLTVSWPNLFEACQQYREENNLPANELVILLTDIANEHNWFSALDPSNTYNGFVHTSEWEHFVKCSEVFPVAYLVASLILQKHMFTDMKMLMQSVHKFPLGCINDFCEHKSQIMLKLRTADVCHDCMNLLKDNLEPPEIQQALNIFEGVRLRMLFNQSFRQNQKPSKLQVTNRGRIFLPDYGNIEIKLTPLEKTLYLFFLNHPEGMMLHDLVDHKEKLRGIYAHISTSGLLAEIHSRIDSLVDVTSNSVNEKISKIKAAFVKVLGKELATHYYIQGEHSDKKFVPLKQELYVCEFECEK